jgi:hypothetical protein
LSKLVEWTVFFHPIFTDIEIIAQISGVEYENKTLFVAFFLDHISSGPVGRSRRR